MKCENCKKEISGTEEEITEVIFAKGSPNEYTIQLCSVACEFLEIIGCIGLEAAFDIFKKYILGLEHQAVQDAAELLRIKTK